MDLKSEAYLTWEHPWLILERFLKTVEREKYSNAKGRCAILFFQSGLYHLPCHLNTIPRISSSNLKVKEEELHLMFYLWKSCAYTRA